MPRWLCASLLLIRPPLPQGSLIASGECAAELPMFDLTDFKRDLSELSDRLGNAQDCL
jgi:hypothetical protein